MDKNSTAFIGAGYPKYDGMDNYKVKVKRLYRPAFCMIMVWLNDDEDITHDQDNIKHEQLTLAWISYNDGLRKKIALTDGNTKKIIRGLYNNFQSDFSDNIDNIKQVTSLEQALIMIKMIEAFIAECVLSKVTKICL